MTGNERLEGGISIVEGAVRIRFADGSLKTLHSNDIFLDEPETPLYKMVDQKIDVVYRPWEEKTENMKYKEEKKKAEKAESGLFDLTNTSTSFDTTSSQSDDNQNDG